MSQLFLLGHYRLLPAVTSVYTIYEHK